MKRKVSVVLLCGGESRRMGQDKGNLKWRDESFLEHIIGNVTRDHDEIEVDEVILSLRDKASGAVFGCQDKAVHVYDMHPGCGPLAGVEAAFPRCKNDLVFVTACDMPFVDVDAIGELYRMYECESISVEKQVDAVVPVEANGRMHGLCGLYRRDVSKMAEKQLKEEDYRLRSWIGKLQVSYVKVSDLTDGENKLRNINTQKDYKHMIENKNIHNIPICSIVAYSGTGKTTFIVKLLPELKARGLRVAVMKHDAHDFEIDKEGKDSWKITQAGADVTALISDKKAVIMENRHVEAMDMIDRIEDVDLILTEGFKHGTWPKIMLHREATGKPYPRDPKDCIAVVSDVPVEGAKRLFGLEDVSEVADLILEEIIK